MSGRNGLIDGQILKRLAEGDKSAFDILYFRYSPVIHQTALHFLRDDMKAADLVQELFTQVWVDRENFTDIKDFRAYLTTMGRNLAIKYLKKIAKEQLAREEWAKNSSTPYENKTESQFHHKELEKALNETIELLPPQQRKVYYLARIEGLTYQVISDRLNISTVTVKKHMIAANRFVRERISRQQEI